MMRRSDSRSRKLMPCRKTIGLTVRGEAEPELYLVIGDVFRIINKLLALNKSVAQRHSTGLVEFSEVRFLLRLLGVPSKSPELESDLWIAED